MTAAELKPCPFCGGEPDLMPDRLMAPGAEPPVFCDGCHASAMDATAWNTRVTPPAPVDWAEVGPVVVEALVGAEAWIAEDLPNAENWSPDGKSALFLVLACIRSAIARAGGGGV